MEYDVRHTIHLLAYALGLSENKTSEINTYVWAMARTLELGASQIRASIVVHSREDLRSSYAIFIFQLTSFGLFRMRELELSK